MIRTFLASTAIATTLGLAAVAQTAPEPAPMPAETSDPAIQSPLAPTNDTTVDTSSDNAAEPGAAGGMMAPAEELTPVATADISADKLIGATIETRGGDAVAEVTDVLMTADGTVESYVAQFGGFLGFGSNEVLLTPDEIEVLQDQSGAFVARTDLTPEALEGRPAYEAKQ